MKDTVDSEFYKRMHWNLSYSKGKRLPVYVENPGLEASMASVVSWPPSMLMDTHIGSHQQSQASIWAG